ncbi:MAG: GTPase Era [Acidobacteriota bacterium]
MSEERDEKFLSGYVTITGRTNVGKSTLFNRLVGEKIAIVSDVPQTTRNRILGVRTEKNFQIAFVDVPGFHTPKHSMNRAMVKRALDALEGVDLIVFMIAADEHVGGGDHYVATLIKEKSLRAICAINKVDLVKKEITLPLIAKATNEWGMLEAVPISALNGENCNRLLDVIVKYLPEGGMLFPEHYLTDQAERAIVSEIIREKVFLNMKEEVPHCSAVFIESFQEKGENLVVIEASLFVERESQKGIIIGKGGQMLKKIGMEARKEIERFLSKSLYLDLSVKVKRNWRDDDSLLRKIGLR